MIQLSPEQLRRFEALLAELEPLTTEQRQARLATVFEGDPDLAAVLAAALDEPASMRELRPDLILGAFTLVERISAGGFGEVWRARQSFAGGSDRSVAIKFIRPDLLGASPAEAGVFRELFHREIARLAQFQHPNIVRLFATEDVPLGNGRATAPCYVMEFVDGDRLHPTPILPNREARLRCFLKVCDAVAHSHHHGLVHLDLKPDNIRVRHDGEPVLIDFGLSERCRADRPFQPSWVGRGTLPYMAPEQIGTVDSSSEDVFRRHGPIGKPADVHALGVILFQMLTDRLPYELRESSEAEFRRLICGPTRLSLLACRADEDPRLGEVLMKAMHFNSAQRFRDAGELRDELKASLTGAREQASTEEIRNQVGKGVIAGTIYGGVHFH